MAAGVVAVDHLTKWWATRVLDDRDIHLIGSFRLHLVENAGSAFSMGRGLGPFLGLVAVGVVIVLVQIGRVTTDRWQLLALALVLGGAVGNLTDRVVRTGHGFLHGRVVDFFDLQWWPVFNVADIAISTGAVLLVLLSLPFGSMWLDYGVALLNAQNSRGLEYTLGEWPLMIAPMAAWLGQQTMRRGGRQPATDERPEAPSTASSLP